MDLFYQRRKSNSWEANAIVELVNCFVWFFCLSLDPEDGRDRRQTHTSRKDNPVFDRQGIQDQRGHHREYEPITWQLAE